MRLQIGVRWRYKLKNSKAKTPESGLIRDPVSQSPQFMCRLPWVERVPISSLVSLYAAVVARAVPSKLAHGASVQMEQSESVMPKNIFEITMGDRRGIRCRNEVGGNRYTSAGCRRPGVCPGKSRYTLHIALSQTRPHWNSSGHILTTNVHSWLLRGVR